MKNLLLFLIIVTGFRAVYSQSLSVFNVDTSSFPVMKAQFYTSDSNGVQVHNLSTSDFQITENGILRTILSVSCPVAKPPVDLSSVLVMDKSGSMGEDFKLQSIYEVAKAWIDALPGKSECAITSFDDKNYIIQDFTTDKSLLKQKAGTISANGGTDYNKALIDPMAGGILIAQTAQYKKVIILLSDGQPNNEPRTQEIIKQATLYGIVIYFVSLGNPCPQCMKEITSQTGGEYFENITTVDEAKQVYLKILNTVDGNEPCDIEWQSGVGCRSGLTSVEVEWNTAKNLLSYFYPNNSIPSLTFNPQAIYFQNKQSGKQADTTITVTAQYADFNITDIIPSSPYFSIKPTSFFLKNGQSLDLTLSFNPPDSNNYFCNFNIANDKCPANYYAASGFNKRKNTTPTLKLTCPNGGEQFLVGSDTVITWEGVIPTTPVKLEYSTDKGTTWEMITNYATGLKYTWQNIPNTPSNQCLARVSSGKNNLFDSVPYIEWEKSLGGSSYDNANSIQQTFDGGYIVAGTSYSSDGDVIGNHGNYDYWIVKLDNSGTVKWQKSFGGTQDDEALSVQQTLDCGFIVAGFSNSTNGDVSGSHGLSDFWVIKLDIDGNLLWQKSFGGNNDDRPTSIQQTRDLGYIIAGHTFSKDGDVKGNHGNFDYWIVKLDLSGNLVWQRTLGGSQSEHAEAIRQTSDNGYIVAGYSNSNDGDVSGNHGLNDYWIVKLDINGNILWQKSYGGSGNDLAYSVQQTDDGGYIVAGESDSNDGDVIDNHGSYDYWIIKLNSIGKIQWQKSLGGSLDDVAYSLGLTDDGGYIIAGYTSSSDGDITLHHGFNDFWLVRLDDIGDMIWQKSLGGIHNDVAASIQQTNDEGYIVAGKSDSFDGDISGNHGTTDYTIFKLSPENYMGAQRDFSDSLWSIVKPSAVAIDLDMKQCLVGSIKDSVITTFITNTGTYPCRIDTIYFVGADASKFILVSGFFPYEIPVGDTKSVEIAFQPASVGVKNATIKIKTQADILTQNIRGEGVQPFLSVINNIIDFGIVEVGTIKDTLKAVTIKNIGTAQLNIIDTKNGKPNDYDFSILSGGGTFTLNPGETKTMDLRFKPSDVGRTSGSLEFYYNGVGSPAIIQLFGEGIRMEPNIAIEGLTIPSLICDSSAKGSFTVDNPGGKTLFITKAYFTGTNNTDFSTDLIGDSIKAIEKKSYGINFIPTEIGVRTANLVIVSNAKPDSVLIIPVIGIKYKVSFSVYPQEINLGDLAENQPKDTSVIITNTGTVDMEIILNCSQNYSLSDNSFFIQSGGSVTLKIHYNGSSTPVNLNDIISITDTLCNKSTIINLKGNIYGPAFAILQAGSAEGKPGEIIEIPIYLTDAQYVNQSGTTGFITDVTFNSTLLAPIDGPAGIIQNGKRTLTINLPNLANNNNELFRLKFMVGLGNDTTCSINLDNYKSVDGMVALNKIDGSFKLLGVCSEGGTRLINPGTKTGILTLAPNPAYEKIDLTFSLIEQGVTDISIFNILGEKILTVFSENVSIAGKRYLLVKTNSLSPGTYSVIFRTPTIVESYKLSVIK